MNMRIVLPQDCLRLILIVAEAQVFRNCLIAGSYFYNSISAKERRNKVRRMSCNVSTLWIRGDAKMRKFVMKNYDDITFPIIRLELCSMGITGLLGAKGKTK